MAEWRYQICRYAAPKKHDLCEIFLRTNEYPVTKALLKMVLLFPRWDILFPCPTHPSCKAWRLHLWELLQGRCGRMLLGSGTMCNVWQQVVNMRSIPGIACRPLELLNLEDSWWAQVVSSLKKCGKEETQRNFTETSKIFIYHLNNIPFHYLNRGWDSSFTFERCCSLTTKKHFVCLGIQWNPIFITILVGPRRKSTWGWFFWISMILY